MTADFKVRQMEFSAYIRDPGKHPAPPDVKTERIAMYRELFFNNIDSFLSGNIPVLRKILENDQWQALARDFFARHTCRTPYFTEITEEFLSLLRAKERAQCAAGAVAGRGLGRHHHHQAQSRPARL